MSSPAWAASSMRGLAPAPTTTKSQGMRVPSPVCTASIEPRPRKADSRCPGPQLDPVLPMEVAVDRPDLGPEDTFERCRLGEDHRDLEAQLTERGRHLGADPAAADHHRLVCAGRGFADRVGVRDGAQVVDTREVRSGKLQASRR